MSVTSSTGRSEGHSAIVYIFPTFELWVFLHRPRFLDQRTLHLGFDMHWWALLPVVYLRPEAQE